MNHLFKYQQFPRSDWMRKSISLTHWNMKMHYISSHTTKEERMKQKYYCESCDKVFFCSAYMNKHNESTKHKNMVLAIQLYNEIYQIDKN